MSDYHPLDLEDLWERLLSRRPRQVRAAFESLTSAQQTTVLEHLRRMASEPDWHPEQQRSAAAALKAVEYPQDRKPSDA